MNIITRFLCVAGGANLAVLQKTPTEVNKYASIGATVLMTAIFAAISGGYAISQITSQVYYSITLGILWGLAIFNIDRFLVMSIDSRGKAMNRFLKTLPRLILAILIALVIAKPLEVKLFSSRINEQLEKQRLDSETEVTNKIRNLYQLEARQESINNLESNRQEFNSRKNQILNTPEIQILDEERKKCEDSYAKRIKEYQPRINKIRAEIDALRANEKSYLYVDEKKEILPNVKQIISAKTREYRDYSNRLRSIKAACDNTKKDLDRVLKDNMKQIQDELNALNLRIRDEKHSLDTMSILANKEIEASRTVTKLSYEDNFIAQIEALETLKNENRIINMTSLWIMLLFVFIEISPILIKLLSKEGSYEAMVIMQDKVNLTKANIIIQKEEETIKRLAAENTSISSFIESANDEFDKPLRLAVFGEYELLDTRVHSKPTNKKDIIANSIWANNEFSDLSSESVFIRISELLKREKYAVGLNQLFFLLEKNGMESEIKDMENASLKLKYLLSESENGTIDEKFAKRQIAEIMKEIHALLVELSKRTDLETTFNS